MKHTPHYRAFRIKPHSFLSPPPAIMHSTLQWQVYDLPGREVSRLVNDEFKVAGKYTYDFNAASLSSGVYFCRLNAGKFSETKRMVLLK